jgi:hypothetical protein
MENRPSPSASVAIVSPVTPSRRWRPPSRVRIRRPPASATTALQPSTECSTLPIGNVRARDRPSLAAPRRASGHALAVGHGHAGPRLGEAEGRWLPARLDGRGATRRPDGRARATRRIRGRRKRMPRRKCRPSPGRRWARFESHLVERGVAPVRSNRRRGAAVVELRQRSEPAVRREQQAQEASAVPARFGTHHYRPFVVSIRNPCGYPRCRRPEPSA